MPRPRCRIANLIQPLWSINHFWLVISVFNTIYLFRDSKSFVQFIIQLNKDEGKIFDNKSRAKQPIKQPVKTKFQEIFICGFNIGIFHIITVIFNRSLVNIAKQNPIGILFTTVHKLTNYSAELDTCGSCIFLLTLCKPCRKFVQPPGDKLT